jgi:hypothetical protein
MPHGRDYHHVIADFSARPDWRADAYALVPALKTLATLFRAEHIFGGISGWDTREASDEDPARLAEVQRLTWAYLRSALCPTRRCHAAILARGGTAIIPIRKNGRFWKEDCLAAIARNDILRATRLLGRAIWKRWSGYHIRSRIEAKMRGLKSFGERIASRDPDRQTAEIQIRIALMNRFNALGQAEIERVA